VYDYEYGYGSGYEWVATMHPCTGTSERTFLVIIIIIVRSIEMVRRAKQRRGHLDPYTDALWPPSVTGTVTVLERIRISPNPLVHDVTVTGYIVAAPLVDRYIVNASLASLPAECPHQLQFY